MFCISQSLLLQWLASGYVFWVMLGVLLFLIWNLSAVADVPCFDPPSCALVQKVGSRYNADELNILKVNTDEQSQLASAYRVQVRISWRPWFFAPLLL